MRNAFVLFLVGLFGFGVTASSQESQGVSEQQERVIRARYPQTWDVEIPEGTRLAALKSQYDRRLAVIQESDVEDEGPYPLWFRAYLRANLPGLPTSGPYQYPRVAAQILEWMVSHPDLVAPGPSADLGTSRNFTPSRALIVGTNINVSNLDERNSESFVAVDYGNPQYLVAASNNINGSGRQKQFRSSDSGATWTKSELPLAPGSAFNSDPALAWTTDGTAWAATLGINNTGTSVQVQAYKSTDRGATWSFVSTVSSGGNNDKEMLWVDTFDTSPRKDNIYLAWDVPGSGMRFSRSTDLGASWSPVMTLSNDGAIGAHLTTGPSGELYIAWPDTRSRELRIRKSTDGGASFDSTKIIARTNDSYEVSVPAMCGRKILIYLSIGVDRSDGPRKGWVYATWTDRNGSAPDPGCNSVDATSNANVYFSRSEDGGDTWSTPKIIHSNADKTDQFNQWMDVDPTDGAVHVAFYDTRDDTGRKKSNLYYVGSTDGGDTWTNETRVTTDETDETVAGADLGNQYGDYNGLVAYRGTTHPVWTDRRSGVPGNKEQIFTAALTSDVQTVVPDIGRCTQYPWLCGQPRMQTGAIELACPFRGCVLIDPIPMNCTEKFQCPGCSSGGLCPPFYHLFLDGLDENVWSVGLFDLYGQPVPYEKFTTSTGTVLSFQPQPALFIDGQIGDYLLAFQLGNRGTPATTYTVQTRLNVSDRHYSPPGPTDR